MCGGLHLHSNAGLGGQAALQATIVSDRLHSQMVANRRLCVDVRARQGPTPLFPNRSGCDDNGNNIPTHVLCALHETVQIGNRHPCITSSGNVGL